VGRIPDKKKKLKLIAIKLTNLTQHVGNLQGYQIFGGGWGEKVHTFQVTCPSHLGLREKRSHRPERGEDAGAKERGGRS